MKNKNRFWIWSLAAASLLIGGASWPFLPDQVPMHWDINGHVTYRDKWMFLLMAALPLLLAAMLIYLPKIDPKKKNYEKFGRYYNGFGIFMMVFLLITNLIVLSEAFFPGQIRVGMVIQILVGLMLLFIGNMMPKFKSNFFIGIKTPWTISHPDVWNKTHRLGGALLFATGLLILCTCFWVPETVSFWMLMGAVLLSAILPTVMSYIWYRKLAKTNPDDEGSEGESQA